MRNDNAKVERQFDFFLADNSEDFTQAGMTKLIKGATRRPDISKSVQSLQLAIDKAKVSLDFAVSPST